MSTDEAEIAEEYRSSLKDLVCNSKPLITMLTMLAEENRIHAGVIVKVIEEHIRAVVGQQKLPVMYLIDSIMKNVAHEYVKLFGHNIINIFSLVFEKVDERTRKKLYELRTTWNDVFPKSKLYGLDVKVQTLDPAWPLPALPSLTSQTQAKPNIHINPNMIKPGVVKGAPTTKSKKDIEVLKLRREEELLSLERQKLAWEKKEVEKILLQQAKEQVQNRLVKTEGEADKSVADDPSISSERRSQFLRSYKIKKKNQTEEEPQVSSTIHVDPRRMHKVLPVVTGASSSPLTSQDSRRPAESSRDPRLGAESSRDPRLGGESSSRDSRFASDAATSSRDPRLGGDNSSRDPRLAADSSSRDPRLSKTSISPTKPSKSSTDTRSSVKEESGKERKEVDNKKEKEEKERKEKREKDEKEKKEKDEKEKKEREEKKKDHKDHKSHKDHHHKSKKDSLSPSSDKKRESSKSRSKSSREKDSVSSASSSSPSKPESTSKKSISPVPPTTPPTFRSKRSRHQRTYMKREKTPEDEDEKEGGGVSKSESVKKSKPNEDASDSDSDHYEGNKPKPSAYNKQVSGKKSESTSSSVSSSTVGDTDYRQFTTPPKQKDENVSPGKKDCTIDELFSKKDVDYRQLLPQPNMMQGPGGGLPAAFKLPKKEEDQSARDPLSTLSENQDPNKTPSKDSSDSMGSAAHMFMDPRNRKNSFNSPHAASWEKFRQKNPEFKEYERQASMSDVHEGEEGDFSQQQSSEFRTQEVSSQGVNREGLRPPFEDEDSQVFPERSQAAAEKFQMMLQQAMEQRNCGDISEQQYENMAKKIRMLTEQEQIREVRERDRQQRQQQGENQQNVRPLQPPFKMNDGGNESPGPGGSISMPPRGLVQGQFPQAGRGGGRGGFMNPSTNSGPNLGPGGCIMDGGPQSAQTGWNRGGVRNSFIQNWGVRDTVIEEEWTGEPDLPYVTEETLKIVAREAETKTIDIDGVPREIRTYGETAVILLDWDDPRIIEFGDARCNIVFDNGEFILTMRIGEDYKEFTISGETHRVKLGVPTQELMLDGRGYQCFFGGKPIPVHLAGQTRTVHLDGKPPNVNIGPVRNTEFLAGKVQLVINAQKVVNLFLDSKPQRFNIDGKPFVIRFVDNLRAVTINNVRFPVEFGGLPISISVRGYRRFLRLTSLPPGIIPGQVCIRGMEIDKALSSLPGSPAQGARNSPSLDMSRGPTNPVSGVGPLPGPPPPPINMLAHTGGMGGSMPTGPLQQTLGPNMPGQLPLGMIPLMMNAARLTLAHSQQMQLPPHPQMMPQNQLQPLNRPPHTQPPHTQPQPQPKPHIPQQVHPQPPPQVHPAQPGAYSSTQQLSQPPQPTPPTNPIPTQQLDLNSLLESLTRTGLINKPHQTNKAKRNDSEHKKKEEEEEKEKDDLIPFDTMFSSENLRKRRAWKIECLYRGMQCSSCGGRYPPEQTLQYSNHLDWHFRQNKKQQESTKKANSRKFFFSTDDWMQYEEIEDVEERVPSMFETEGMVEAMEAEETEEPSVAVSSDTSLGVCPVCHDTFSQFFHQETEEWRYHNATQVEDINYHPACLLDLNRAEEAEKEKERLEAEKKEKEEKEAEKEDGETKKKEEEEKAESKKEEDEKEKEAGKDGEKKDKIEEKEKKKEDKESTAKDKPSAQEVNPVPPIRIKEEPMEVEELESDYVTPTDITPAITVKQEVKEEPPDIPDDIDAASPKDNLDEENTESIEDSMYEQPVVNINAAETDIASSIDGNMELSTPATTNTAPTITKIRLNISKPAAPVTSIITTTTSNNNNNDNSNNNNNNKNNNDTNQTNHHVRNSLSIDEDMDEFVPPSFTVDYTLKPAFKGVELEELPPTLRGEEMSGLCSIM